MKTQRVTFRKWKDNGNVIAFFLDQPESKYTSYCMAYEHVGQHGPASYPHSDTIPAKPHEYADLLKELQAIGYDDLRIVKRGRINY